VPDNNLKELRGSGDFKAGQSGTEGKGRCVVIGADDQDDAYNQALDYFPELVGGIPRASIDVQDQGGGIFTIEVDYSTAARDTGTAGGAPTSGGKEPSGGRDKNEPMGRKYSVSTKGGTIHITRSRFTISSFGRNFGAGAIDPPDFKGLLNPKKLEGGFYSSDGIDIVSPNAEITISETADKYELGYFLTICDATGTINVSDWGGFGEAELLFLGQDAQNRDGPKAQWDLTWHFRYAPTETEIDICGDGSLVVDTKQGWDYLSVAYRANTNPANIVVDEPFAAYVERVYRTSDFASLGIT
jgi:hypothetical protein